MINAGGDESVISNNHQPANPLRIISVCLDEISLTGLQRELRSMTDAEFLTNLSQYLGAADGVGAQRMKDFYPDIVMLDFDQDRVRAAATAEHLEAVFKDRVAIFAVSSKSEPDLIISAMRSGCSEYLVKPLLKERIVQAFTKAATRKQERERGKQRGKIITMLGAKGGAGVTTIAVHISTFLAKLRGGHILLIDQHPDLGDTALYLGIDKHLYHFYDLANNVQRLDAKLVQGFVVHHSSGLDVLASPDGFVTGVSVSGPDVESTLEFLKTIYDYIVIDCAPGLSGLNLAAVQHSDEVWLIATPDVPSVRNLSRYLEHLTRFSYPVDSVRVLINRYSKRGEITREHLEKVLRKSVYMTVPNSYAEVMDAVNTGTPVAPGTRSEFAAALRQWTDSLSGNGAVVSVPAEKRRWTMLGL
jgi:pilus assembly protein CpaE